MIELELLIDSLYLGNSYFCCNQLLLLQYFYISMLSMNGCGYLSMRAGRMCSVDECMSIYFIQLYNKFYLERTEKQMHQKTFYPFSNLLMQSQKNYFYSSSCRIFFFSLSIYALLSLMSLSYLINISLNSSILRLRSFTSSQQSYIFFSDYFSYFYNCSHRFCYFSNTSSK